jgi:hypothetical protein
MTGKFKLIRASNPTMLELYKLLLKSDKFLNWKPRDLGYDPALSSEKHFSVAEVAGMWAVSTDLVRDVFKDENGVLIVERPGTRTKRSYSTMRIPESVLERVYNRLSKR